MTENLQFKISSELKNIIGRDLINDDFIAIYELVKNSFDARARKVELIFKRVESHNWSENAKIFIKDYGDGMSYSDILDKWLLVGYSRKREGEKIGERIEDYRNKITKKRAVAGAKGIGRFSCDRLGSKLKLYSKKLGDNFFNTLDMNWNNFEEDPNKEFQTINVKYEKKPKLDIEIETSDLEKGTILEISSLRERWNRDKILRLKRHLQRLINPSAIDEGDFTISIQAEEFLEDDKNYKEDYDIVNGPVKNIIFEQLGIKTTHLKCTLDEKGEKIRTELIDKGTFIYSIEEDNDYLPLHNVVINLFTLIPKPKPHLQKRWVWNQLIMVPYFSIKMV